ncbi:fungal-specific transcription factor domain-containing protein [Dendryphion nanum]|uniref:Fungal-specific transcription factor domain-containing protein n=1 Tax=Dendryphion nanum TaxID=256645 RepID=A0A9P9D7G7_9PLEO|nr:fungal-specific transcription factor domain-containing protein [Dendryphion nanum]
MATDNSAEVPDVDVDLPSCDGCRRRKLRCSRAWPTCTHCRRLASECTYEYQRKKPGLKGGAVDALSRRVEALEKFVFDTSERVSSTSTIREASEHPVSSVTVTSNNTHELGGILSVLTKEIRHLNSSLSTPSARTAQLATSSPSVGHDPVQHEAHDWQSQHPRKRTRVNGHSYQIPSDNYNFDPHPLFSRPDFIEQLLDAYFGNVHPWIPILHETRFRSKLADRKYLDQSLIILHAILVSALRLVENNPLVPIVDIQDEVRKSRAFINFNAMSDLTVENLQALVIIAFTDIGQGETTKAWTIIGSLARTVQYLHLSVEDTNLVEPAALLSNLPSLHPPCDWIEEEERRRLFWNVFVLDRFCSITTGWNVSLTADDVCRRLPIDGGLWKRNQSALTPYLGIWDHSAAKIGHSITYLPSKYDEIERVSETNSFDRNSATNSTGDCRNNPAGSSDMSNIGAFAYYIESVESLSRINTYFIQQEIDFTNRQEVSSWLTRFKELDLRLVHWKMFLPQRWKSPNNNPASQVTSTAMDPNMTLAHITHNMSSILLHQRIGYPRDDLLHLNLPNACSADTCLVAANITTKYLGYAPARLVFAPHFAVCIFVSAKVLLVHSIHYKMDLALEFWILIEALEAMSSRWIGPVIQAGPDTIPFARSLAMQLRQLHSLCMKDPGNHSLAFFNHVSPRSGHNPRAISAPDGRTRRYREGENNTPHASAPLASGEPMNPVDAGALSDLLMANRTNPNLQTSEGLEYSNSSPYFPFGVDPQQSLSVRRNSQVPIMDTATDELSIISQGFMDRHFLEMNRIINFDDFMFNTDDTGFSGISSM